RGVVRVAHEQNRIILAGEVGVPVDLEDAAGSHQTGGRARNGPGAAAPGAGNQDVVGRVVMQVLVDAVGQPGAELRPEGVGPVLGVQRAEDAVLAARQDDVAGGGGGEYLDRPQVRTELGQVGSDVHPGRALVNAGPDPAAGIQHVDPAVVLRVDGDVLYPAAARRSVGSHYGRRTGPRLPEQQVPPRPNPQDGGVVRTAP